MPSAFIYIRVSTEQQARPEHVSLAAQQAACLKAVRAAGFKTAKVFKDIGSARRPEALTDQARMWKVVKRGNIVFCHSYDRISRDMAYGAALMKRLDSRGVQLQSVTEPLDYSTPAGFHQLMNIFNNAEFSSRNLGLKVKTAFDQIREGGGCVGPAPYGWEIDPDQPGRKLRSSDHEQRVIAFARALRLGTKDMRGINNILMQIIPRKRPDLMVALELHNEDGTHVKHPEPKAVDYDNIASILNSYEVPYRGKRQWSAGTVRNIILHDRHVCDEVQLAIGMEAITVEQDIEMMEEKPTETVAMTDVPTVQALSAQIVEMRTMFQAFMAFAGAQYVTPVNSLPALVDSNPPTHHRRRRRADNVAPI
jgi:DNA invertase Pin-like site-specific DNA recombinase